MDFKHILLATDLSEESHRAFRPACNLARAAGARITLVHVIQLINGEPIGDFVQGDPGTIGAKRAAEKALEEETELLDEDLEVRVQVVTDSNVAKAIASWADVNDVGLIVLSTHGRSGFRRLVLGSVAEEVLRRAHVPVLCFPCARKTVT